MKDDSIYDDFVFVDEFVPGIRWEAKYATWDNFTGKPVDGYVANRIVGTRALCAALERARVKAASLGFGLLLWDGYRPQRAVDCFLRWSRQPEDGRTKLRHYPNIDRSEMFERGYVAAKSGHSRGSTVDLTLYHLVTGELAPMGGDYDLMDPISHHGAKGITQLEARNRQYLCSIMEECGFSSYDREWWHYTLKHEPYPNTYFDFPITYAEPTRTTTRTCSLVSSSSSTFSSSSPVPKMGITIYGCGQDEAVLFREMAPRFGVTPTCTDAALSEANVELAFGNRCISVSHKTQITNSILFALSQAGVKYISTRSIGYDHINVRYAQSVGISVENVAYSPDSVADHTLMLMLVAVRNAKSIVSRAGIYDFRLNDVRGKELRDLTIGVIGTGRIGAAVIDRLRGFGCRILACDKRPKTSADYVPLDELLQQSDIVTLHTPLNADTHHLLNRQRIEQVKHGAFIINTGRGSLLDTEVLISALESGKLGGAALDVLEGEEGIFYADCRNKPIENSLLLRLAEFSNVLITPHTAYYTEHALRDTVENSIINCLKFGAAASSMATASMGNSA